MYSQTKSLLDAQPTHEDRYKVLRTVLEACIDSQYDSKPSGLSAVLDAIYSICLEKAEHVRTTWQDEALAKEWEAAARKLSHQEKGTR